MWVVEITGSESHRGRQGVGHVLKCCSSLNRCDDDDDDDDDEEAYDELIPMLKIMMLILIEALIRKGEEGIGI